MGVAMNMSNYKIEQEYCIDAAYSEEVLCSGWNPAISLACQLQTLSMEEKKIPLSLATVDAESFLRKMYASQC